jgi:hypothetical protein
MYLNLTTGMRPKTVEWKLDLGGYVGDSRTFITTTILKLDRDVFP